MNISKRSVNEQLRYSAYAVLVTLALFVAQPFLIGIAVLAYVSLIVGLAGNVFFIYGFILLGQRFNRPFIVYTNGAGVVVTVIGSIESFLFSAHVLPDATFLHLISVGAGLVQSAAGTALLGLRPVFGRLATLVGVLSIIWGLSLSYLSAYHILYTAESAASVTAAFSLALGTCILNIAEAVLFFRAAREA